MVFLEEEETLSPRAGAGLPQAAEPGVSMWARRLHCQGLAWPILLIKVRQPAFRVRQFNRRTRGPHPTCQRVALELQQPGMPTDGLEPSTQEPPPDSGPAAPESQPCCRSSST